MFYFVSAVLGRGVGGVHIQLKLSQQKLKIGCFCCLSTSKCWLLRRAVEESHPLNISSFSQIISHKVFQLCITNIIRIIVSIKINSDWMVVLHQLVAAFVSLVQMVQLATKCRNVGQSVTIHLVVKYALCACWNYLHLCGRNMFVSKQSSKHLGRFSPTKNILESRYKAPVV